MLYVYRFPRRFVRCISVFVCLALVAGSLLFRLAPLTSHAQNQRQSSSANGKARKEKPTPPEAGAPAYTLPNLDEVKRRPQTNPEAPPAISSSIRARRKPLAAPKKLTPPDTTTPRASSNVRPSEGRSLHHISRNRKGTAIAPPLLADDQYVQHFLSSAIPNYQAIELSYWTDMLRVAQAQGLDASLLAVREMGRTIFESSAYAGRARTDHEYVSDLYQTYLMRAPDGTGWAFWESCLPLNGRLAVRAGFLDASSEFHDLVATLTPNGPMPGAAGSIASARLDPFNQTGDQIQARDCEFNLSLLSLPGRAGLDLGLGLSYSSLVWTPSGPYLYFDEDNSPISPGFRLGFASIQGPHFDAQVGAKSYLLISSSGRRVGLRQVGASNVYEAGDSSYLQLIDNGNNTLVLRSTDGTQIDYESLANGWQATQVKDRNGNYLSIEHNPLGDIQTIVDTLGRVIYFNYDGNANLSSIIQYRNGSWHTWATFGWGAALSMDVSSLTGAAIVGTTSGEAIPVLRQVGLPDGSYHQFEYNATAQVSAIRRFSSDNAQRSYATYVYDNSASDCPRINQTRVGADNWTGYYGVPSEVTTQYGELTDGSHQMVAPDLTTYREVYGTGWQKGLVTRSEIWGKTDPSDTASPVVLQKWTTTQWGQDNQNVVYQTNPRATETNVWDAGGNRRRTTIDYGQFGLPNIIVEYLADGSIQLRRTYFNYDLSQTYLTRRIIGLVTAKHVYDNLAGQWQEKVTYQYDDPYGLQTQATSAPGHDLSFNTSFLARGNVTAVTHWDSTDLNNTAKALTSQLRYDAAGSVTSSIDPLGHQNSFGYADSFADGLSRNTFAYPTLLSDADSHASTVLYDYSSGVRVRFERPTPAGQSAGLIQTFAYDNALRLERTTIENTGAYTRYVYGPYYVMTWSSVNNAGDDALAINIFDGAGRTVSTLAYHPGSAGGYQAQFTQYDIMGRPRKQSNPAEVNGYWQPAGDDAAGRIFATQTYDWKGRPLVTTSTDGSVKYASYSGCGCAGGEVVTLTDEAGRQQRIYSDVLGRPSKTEVLDSSSNVYSSTATIYDARDQVTAVNSYKGAATSDLSCPSGTCMQSVTTYDGHGRVASHRLPQQATATTYEYYADDTVHTVTDPRGVVATNSYNSRHLLTGITYSPAGGVPALAAVSYAYDAAGNRTSMSDGSGSTSYVYDSLSRMTNETRTFNFPGFSNSYSIGYGYGLTGQITSLTDPSGAQVSYNYDSTGRLSGMPASGYNGVTSFLSNAQYRASGAMKHATYGSSVQIDLSYNSRLQIEHYQVSGLYAYQGGPALTMGANLSYYDDGRTKTAFDLNDSRFDRRYEFDFSARLKEAYSGVEAHGASPPPLNQANSPYRQTYTYDEWNNVTLRQGRIWSAQTEYDVASYGSDNKRSGFAYDNAGNVTVANNDGTRTYDAAGRPVTFTSAQNWQVYPNWPGGHPDAPALETEDTFDGTGQVVKHVNHVRHDDTYDIGGGNLVYTMSDTTTTTYLLHSTVLGGKTIVELNQSGVKTTGYVYAGGGRIATQTIAGTSNSVVIESTNPVTGAAIMTDANGTYATRQEPDPLGRELSVAPDATVVVDPIASSKWNEPMPIEYAPNWTGEAQAGMFQYVNTMDMIGAHQAYTRWLKSEKRSNADYNMWQSILTKNPNVGIVAGKKTWWGSDATDYLNRHSASITLGNNGEILQQRGGRILIIVGDSGLNNHSVGDNFNRVAQTKQEELEDEGYSVIVQRASSVTDFGNAMTNNGMLDGVEYIGHARNNMLFIGEQPGADTNLHHNNIQRLSNANLNADAYIKLNACNAGVGDYVSIAQWLANWLGRSVGTFDGPTHFYGSRNPVRTSPRPGEQAPSRGPLYLLEDSGTHFVVIKPG